MSRPSSRQRAQSASTTVRTRADHSGKRAASGSDPKSATIHSSWLKRTARWRASSARASVVLPAPTWP
jgi:hypothetical protein